MKTKSAQSAVPRMLTVVYRLIMLVIAVTILAVLSEILLIVSNDFGRGPEIVQVAPAQPPAKADETKLPMPPAKPVPPEQRSTPKTRLDDLNLLSVIKFEHLSQMLIGAGASKMVIEGNDRQGNRSAHGGPSPGRQPGEPGHPDRPHPPEPPRPPESPRQPATPAAPESPYQPAVLATNLPKDKTAYSPALPPTNAPPATERFSVRVAVP